MHSTLNLPTALEDPMPDTVPSGVGQQLLIPHEYAEAGREISDNEWAGRLYSNWNGTYACARALAAEAIGNPYVHALL